MQFFGSWAVLRRRFHAARKNSNAVRRLGFRRASGDSLDREGLLGVQLGFMPLPRARRAWRHEELAGRRAGQPT
ncbi:hypothetical protein L596_028222 [Steinernema carpocapsae]|uniref:Uncharacterized protein n=1 Tax=Steinernema carpocapsae TaxID=34508 RepID=A0A4U5LXV3_STECR|nr:hypothetical protein L596_028222 [Steinernema carpocapsae]